MNKISLITFATLFIWTTTAMAGWFSWEDDVGNSRTTKVTMEEDKSSDSKKRVEIKEKATVSEGKKPQITETVAKNKKVEYEVKLNREIVEKDNPKNIYVNKHLQVFVPQEELYIYLSLSDNPDDKKVFLPNNASVESHKSKPVKLGKPGLHTISHLFNPLFPNSDGKIDKNDPSRDMKVTWDNMAPSLRLINTDSKVEVVDSGKIQSFKGSSKFKLYALDDYSGTKAVYYSLDGGAHQIKNEVDEISGLSDGRHTLFFYTVDNVGNISDLIKKEIIIDDTKPKTYIQIHTTSKTKEGVLIAGPDSAVSMSSADNLSTVDGIYYKISRPAFAKYSKAIPLRALDSGKYSVLYYSQDRVGNKEDVQKLDFYMDNEPPKTEMVLAGDYYGSKDKKYISNRTIIDLKSKDFSGVAKSYISLNSSKKKKKDAKRIEYKSGITAKDLMTKLNSKKTGDLILGYSSVDKVGNKEVENGQILTLDTKAPTPHISFAGDHIFKSGKHYISDRTRVKLSAKDDSSGVKEIAYKVNDGPFEKYILDIDLSKYSALGKMQLNYNSMDNVGNKSKDKSVDIVIDKNPPRLFHYYSYNGRDAINIKLKDDTKMSIPNHPLNTKLYLAGEDDLIGLKDIYYTINGGKRMLYKAPVRFDKDGAYKVVIEAVDKLNNTKTFTSNVRIINHDDPRIDGDVKLDIDFKDK